jgi:signal transduction histidine kinase
MPWEACMSRRLMGRMIAPVAAISVLLLLLGGAAAWYVHHQQRTLSDVLAVNVASVRAAEKLEMGLQDVRGVLKDYQHTGDPEHLKAIQSARAKTDHWLHEAERLATTPREQELIARVKQGYGRFFAEADRQAARGRPAGPAAADRVRALEGVLTEEILGPAQEYLDLNEQTAVRNSAQNQETTRLMVLALVLLAVCGCVAGLLAGYGIARGIARSIGQLSGPLQDAAGKLNEVVGQAPVSTGRELPDLEANLHEFARQAGAVVERLHESQREALRAEQLAAVGQLAAGLAHELRNPLMSMKVLVQPAAGWGSAVSLSERDLEVLNEEITRLEGLIQTFLDFARPPRPEKRPFELCAALAQTAVLVSGRAERQGVRLERDGAGEPMVVEADVGQVRQVVLNLLLNALEATPEGGTVTVRARRGGDGPSAWVAVEVSDTGRGLPADLGPRIFEPFVSTKETGLGLGLSICRRIVEAHGGDLAAANRPGGRAVHRPAAAARARPAPSRAGGAEGGWPCRRCSSSMTSRTCSTRSTAPWACPSRSTSATLTTVSRNCPRSSARGRA